MKDLRTGLRKDVGQVRMKMNDKDGLHMDKMINCSECEFMKAYDYGKKIFYCDHVDRIDDIGKLSVNELPKRIPEWCPLRNK